MTVSLCAIFFASGISALIFETLWFRQAGLGFGNSVWASSLVLSGFMGGLALGNALAARYGSRFANPIRLYAIAEVAIALTGVGLVYLLPVFGAALAPWLHPLLEQPWILNPLRLLIAFTLLLIPSSAMGVTLPMLTKALIAYDSNFGCVLGRLYGWNTLGGVGGVILAEAYLIGAFGVHGTAFAGGTLNLVAAVVAAGLSSRTPLATSAMSAPMSRPAPYGAKGGQWLIAAFFSGFCLLALEVVWFRFLLLFVLGQSIAFAVMLGVVLAGIALGGLAASQWLRLSPDAHRFAAPIAFATGLLCVLAYTVFLPLINTFGIRQIHGPLDVLHLGAPLMFPVCFLSGVLFTLLGAALRIDLASETATTGTLTLSNTIGAALGSLAAGFFLLPVLGMERSFFLIALLYGGIGVFLLLSSPAPRRMGYVAATLFLLGAVLFPFGLMDKDYFQFPVKRYLKADPTARVAAIREGLTETVIYVETPLAGKPLGYRMLTNSYSMAGTDYQSRRYMKLFVYWPMAVHPNLKHALLLCYGVGNTAKAMTDTRSLEAIDVVDVSRDILQLNRIVYPDETDSPLHDPRVHLHIEDGRYFLQTSEQRFDLITGEPPPPQIAGVVNLYTREYFQLLHDRLAEGGIVAYWLPVHDLTDASTKAILRAFCDVFEDCSLWNGMGTNLIMAGTRNARGPVSEEQFTRQWQDPVVSPEMRSLGFERPEQLGALFIGDAKYLNRLTGHTPSLVDDYPKRLSSPWRSKEGAAQLIQGWMDATAAKERFGSSSLVKRLWPERLLNNSLSYFEFQGVINAQWYRGLSELDRGIPAVHYLLTHSPLAAPVLWLLGSNADAQRIVFSASPQALENPFRQVHLGVGFIAQRNYAAAVEPLGQAELRPEFRDNAFRLRIYALCMAGQTRQAQRLAQERFAQILGAKGMTIGSMKETDLPPFWLWMKKTFEIDPLQAPEFHDARPAGFDSILPAAGFKPAHALQREGF